MTALYVCMMTLTTVGLGDISPWHHEHEETAIIYQVSFLSFNSRIKEVLIFQTVNRKPYTVNRTPYTVNRKP